MHRGTLHAQTATAGDERTMMRRQLLTPNLEPSDRHLDTYSIRVHKRKQDCCRLTDVRYKAQTRRVVRTTVCQCPGLDRALGPGGQKLARAGAPVSDRENIERFHSVRRVIVATKRYTQ